MRMVPFALAGLTLSIAGCFTVQTPPTGGDDANVTELAVDVVGEWHGCAVDLHFAPRTEGAADGTATLTNASTGCTSGGSYVVHGHVLHATWDLPSCTMADAWDREAVRVADGIVFVDLADGHGTHYVSDTTPWSVWRLDATDGSGASTTMRILGSTETHVIGGCYWSTDHACGGLISCGGNVSEWTTDATTFHATTVCTGGCPCAAVLDGAANATGTYDATFAGANCGRMWTGAFTATQLEAH